VNKRLAVLTIHVLGIMSSSCSGDSRYEGLAQQAADLEDRITALEAELSEQNTALAGKAEASDVYSRAEIDDALGSLPWTIALPPTSVTHEGDALWVTSSGGGQGGLLMPETGFSRIYMGFILPPTFESGSNVEIRIAWVREDQLAPGCSYELTSNGAQSFRAGELPGGAAETFRPSSNGNVVLPAPAGQHVQELIVDLDFLGDSEPGDYVTYQFFRDPTDVGDTCDSVFGSFIIVGISAHPSTL
jgi:hypothetical protein